MNPTPLTPADSRTPPRAKPRGRRVFVLLVLVATVGLGGWWWLRPRGPEPPAIPPEATRPEVVEAITAARKEVLAERKNAKAWGRLGLVFTAHGFDDQAAECFRAAHALDQADDRWPYLLGLYYQTDDRNPPLALRYFEAAFACRHRDAKDEDATRLRLAEMYLAERRLADAERLFREHLTREPREPRALVGLGVTLLAADRPRDAVEFLKGAADSPFTRRKATTTLAAASRLLGDHAAADEYEQLAAKLPEDAAPPDPFTEAAAVLKADAKGGFEEVAALEKEGRIREAVPILMNLAQDPANVRAAVLLGQYLSLLGQHADAEPYLRAACARDPQHVQAALLLGTVLFDLAQAEPDSDRKTRLLRESAEAGARAAKLSPNLGMAHFSRGMALRGLGELPAAVPEFRVAVECRPEVAQFQLGLLLALVDNGMIEEARARLPAAERVIPADNPQLAAVRKRIETAKPSK